MCVCVLITASLHVCAYVHMYALSSVIRVCVYRPFLGDYVYVYVAASTGVLCMIYRYAHICSNSTLIHMCVCIAIHRCIYVRVHMYTHVCSTFVGDLLVRISLHVWVQIDLFALVCAYLLYTLR